MLTAPRRLRLLVDIDRERPIRQSAITVRHADYLRHLPDDLAHLVGELPKTLDRAAVDAITAGSAGGDLLQGFIAGQVWGYGSIGWGPYRLGLSCRSPQLADSLQATRDALRTDGPVAGFEVLVHHRRIDRCGVAFGTKALRFLEPTSGALILDRKIASWMLRVTGVRLPLQGTVSPYARYLDVVHGWSAELAHPAERIEMLMFSDAARDRPGWRVPQLDLLPPLVDDDACGRERRESCARRRA